MPVEYVFGTWTWSDIILSVLALVLLIVLWELVAYPRWRVWAAHMEGLAELEQAKKEQQIQIAQAQSRLDAAELNKQAAIIEAQAVSEQIKTIGNELKSHDLYLRWQWIQMMEQQETKSTVIYVPTEANLPVMEAGRATK